MDKDTAQYLVLLTERSLQHEQFLMVLTQLVCGGFKNLQEIRKLKASVERMPEGPEKSEMAEKLFKVETQGLDSLDMNFLNTLFARMETDHERLEAHLATFKKSMNLQ